jgi:NhaP-type Na+/H+ or K+/H+ antiporter
LLIGAILAPTGPVFASALVGNEKVPAGLRHLLNVGSGVNDGLALPFVMVFLAVAAVQESLHLGELALELAVGVVIGIAVPWVAIRLERAASFPPPRNTGHSTRWRSACWSWRWPKP